MVDTVYLNINPNKHYLTRDELMLIDLLANFDWKRPIYFTQFSSPASLGLKDYLQLDGFAYRFVPIRTPSAPAKKTSDYLKVGRIDSEYLYDKLMNQFRYGNIDDPRVYADHTIQTNFRATFTRGLYAQLADQLLAEGRHDAGRRGARLRRAKNSVQPDPARLSDDDSADRVVLQGRSLR